MSIPKPEEPLLTGGGISVNWYRFLRELALADNASATDLAELTAAIATALGSPDGTLDGIPAAGLEIMQGAGISIAGTDPKFISLSLLEDSGEGDALVKITRDSFGRVEGTEAALAEDLPYDNTASGLAATDVQAALDEVAAGGLQTFNRIDGNGDIRIDGNGDLRISS